MSHIFPPHAPRPVDRLAPDDLSASLRVLEAKLAEGLGEQDIASEAFVDTPVQDDALLLWHADEQYVNKDISGVEDWPFYNQTDVVDIQNTDAWQQVAAFTVSTSNELLYVIGAAQLVGYKVNGSNDSPSEAPYRVQVALYVDDVLTWTISGQEYPDPPHRCIDKATASSNTADWDFRHLRYTHHGWGLSNHLQPVRVVAVVPVLAGTHAIELRARRVPRIDNAKDDDPYESTVQVFNRQLYALRAKDYMVGGWSESSAAIPPVPEGVLTATRLNTPLTEAAALLNDVREPLVRSGALRAEHLSSPVTISDSVVFTDASSVAQSFSAYSGPHNTNGDCVVNGSGARLELIGPFDYRAEGHGVVQILVNIQVWRIQGRVSRDDRVAAVFKLVFVDENGADFVVSVAERLLTPRNQVPVGEGGTTLYSSQVAAPQNVPCEDDVPLVWVADTAELEDATAAHGVWQSVRVDVEGWGPGGIPPLEIKTQRGSLSLAFYKGVRVA